MVQLACARRAPLAVRRAEGPFAVRASPPAQSPGTGQPAWSLQSAALSGSPMAQNPPDTAISLPVRYDASGEISHDTAAAISSGRPILPSGVCTRDLPHLGRRHSGIDDPGRDTVGTDSL